MLASHHLPVVAGMLEEEQEPGGHRECSTTNLRCGLDGSFPSPELCFPGHKIRRLQNFYGKGQIVNILGLRSITYAFGLFLMFVFVLVS